MYVPFLARLLRLGVHHLAFSDEKAVAIVNKASFLIENDRVVSLGSLSGSRPLTLCTVKDAVYFGEYRSNRERSTVRIWSLNFATRQWEPAWHFDGIRHVHGVFHDPFMNHIWVTTGDEDEESAIWRTEDNFESLQRVVGGSQQFRAIQLLFTDDYVFFGSDAPDEKNHIYRMRRNGYQVEGLAQVGGSIFYGCKVGGCLFFSTAVEPSKVNKSLDAEVWGSRDGEHWGLVDRFQKDFLPMKYFQYGQVVFPIINHPEDTEIVYWSPFATNHHGSTVVRKIGELFPH